MQLLSVLLPEGDMPPAMQSTHVLDDLAPVDFEYFPAAQSTHIVDPDNSAYLPAAQSSHDADPNTLLYLPSTQPAHGPPSGPVKPTVHQHAVTMVLPNSE